MRIKKLALLLCVCMPMCMLPATFASAAESDARIAANAEKNLRYLAPDDKNSGPNDPRTRG